MKLLLIGIIYQKQYSKVCCAQNLIAMTFKNLREENKILKSLSVRMTKNG